MISILSLILSSISIILTIIILLLIKSGRLKGADGPQGLIGLSAYDLAVKNGYKGTIGDWLESLQGKSAYELAVENGFEGSLDDWLNSLKAICEVNYTESITKDQILKMLKDTDLDLGTGSLYAYNMFSNK